MRVEASAKPGGSDLQGGVKTGIWLTESRRLRSESRRLRFGARVSRVTSDRLQVCKSKCDLWLGYCECV